MQYIPRSHQRSTQTRGVLYRHARVEGEEAATEELSGARGQMQGGRASANEGRRLYHSRHPHGSVVVWPPAILSLEYAFFFFFFFFQFQENGLGGAEPQEETSEQASATASIVAPKDF